MKESVLKQIAELESLSLGELRKCWRERCDSEPPAYGRAALKRRLAYRIQELAYRGVSEATRAHLRRHLEQTDPEMASGKTTHAARRRVFSAGYPVARRKDGRNTVREYL